MVIAKNAIYIFFKCKVFDMLPVKTLYMIRKKHPNEILLIHSDFTDIPRADPERFIEELNMIIRQLCIAIQVR